MESSEDQPEITAHPESALVSAPVNGSPTNIESILFTRFNEVLAARDRGEPIGREVGPRWVMEMNDIPLPRVPRRFAKATLANYFPITVHQQKAALAAKKFCDMTSSDSPVMLALIGTTGVGKSHLLYAVAKALYERQVRVYANPWYRLADQLRYGGLSVWRNTLRLEPWEVREELQRGPVVLIDEVRPTANTPLDENELAKFSNHAYDEGFSVLVTTNAPLADIMGTPAASRYKVIEVQGPNRRETEKSSETMG